MKFKSSSPAATKVALDASVFITKEYLLSSTNQNKVYCQLGNEDHPEHFRKIFQVFFWLNDKSVS